MAMSRCHLLSILLDPSRRKRRSIVQLPKLLFILWIFIAAANAEPSRLGTRDNDLFVNDSFADDPNLFLDDQHVDVNSIIRLDDTNPFLVGHDGLVSTSLLPDTIDGDHSTTEADSDSMLTDLDSTSLLLEAESHLFADAGLACEVVSTGDDELFGKRRETLCPVPIIPPVKQADTPGNEQSKKKSSQPQTSPWQLFSSDEAVKAGFGENLEPCPKETYLESNTPVCKKHHGVSASDFFTVSGQQWVHLFNVDPGTSAIQKPPCS